MATNYNSPIALVTLVGSLLSCIATTCVLASFTIYRKHLSNFRHALVLNLSIAEFMNSLNNSISGIIYVRNHELKPGPACTINGLVGQLSVQAADFSIVAIALVTLLTVTRLTYMPGASTTKKFFICSAVWFIPLITSISPTAMGLMTPVDGNWCWISGTRSDIRYGMGHGWRFLAIFGTIAIYAYIWIYLRRHLTPEGSSSAGSYGQTGTSTTTSSCFSGFRKESGGFQMMRGEEMEMDDLERPRPVALDTKSERRLDDDGELRQKDYPSMKDIELGGETLRGTYASKGSRGATLQTNASEFPIRRQTHQVDREIRRMLLLNAYPFMYVVLWIPGLVNRLMEASGHSPSFTVMAALQASTQFVGFANAMTYGFNHHLRDRLKGIYFTSVAPRVKRRVTR